MKNSKEDIWNQVRQDKSEIYGKPIFDVFIQMAALSLDHYMQLTEKQKESANTDRAIKDACLMANYDLIKDLMIRELKKNPEKSLASLLFSYRDLDKQKIEQLIVQSKKNLNYSDIYYLIGNSTDLKITASLISDDDLDRFKKEINSHQILSLINGAKNKKGTIDLLGKDILHILSPPDIARLLRYSKNGDKIKLEDQIELLRLLGKDILNKISGFGLSEVLADSKLSFFQVVEYFGVEKLNKLHDNISYRFVQYAKNEEKEEIIKTIIANQEEISSYLMMSFIIASGDPREVIEKLGKENIQRLSATNMGTSDLEAIIKYVKDKDQLVDLFNYISSHQLLVLLNDTSGSFEYIKIAKLAIKFRELSQQDVFAILLYADHGYQKELIELLGDENIKKLNNDDKRKIIARSTGGGSAHINELKKLLRYDS